MWWKVLSLNPRMWEPGVAQQAAHPWRAAYEAATWEPEVVQHLGLPWRAALEAWRTDTLMWLREKEVANQSSVSRWAGFQVVDASDNQWESLLDEGHTSPWPERITDTQGPWGIGLAAHMLRQELDYLALRYDAGLTAGGEDVDWVNRHRARVRRWRFAGARADELARVDQIARHIDASLPETAPYRLPSYWLPSP
ncbi:MAG: hypothetical protein HYX30_16105 [Mycobacterium nebraskense]|nr:hypothetical protein [Mycobacterium nebraskense]